MFVQLPERAVSDLSGGWLDAYVIDAVHYIVKRAQEIDPAARVVINVSFGTYAGPHDGSSLIERALDEIAAKHKVVIVLAAGNVPHTDRPIHAFGQLAPAAVTTLDWHIPGGDNTQTFMEIWVDSSDQNVLPELTVTLTSPNQDSIEVTGPGMALKQPDRGWSANICTAMIACCKTPESRATTVVLLAIGPTADRPMNTRQVQPAPSGRWTVSLHNRGKAPVKVHAWVERDEPHKFTGRAAEQSHLGAALGQAVRPDNSYTLTAQACGTETLVVGGALVNGAAWHGPYESIAFGFDRGGSRQGPDLVAPAARMHPVSPHPTSPWLLYGIEAASNVSTTVEPREGTSMAAPWVSRHAATLLASGVKPTRPAILSAMQAKASLGQRILPPADPNLVGAGALLPDGSFLPNQ